MVVQGVRTDAVESSKDPQTRKAVTVLGARRLATCWGHVRVVVVEGGVAERLAVGRVETRDTVPPFRLIELQGAVDLLGCRENVRSIRRLEGRDIERGGGRVTSRL